MPQDSIKKDLTDVITEMGSALIGDKCLYQKLEFKGGNTVIIYSMGMEFPTSYTRNGKMIKVKTDQGDLLFNIKDSQTIIGEGFAKGLYEKSIN